MIGAAVLATGLLLSPTALLAGKSPDASVCPDAALFCLRAALGPSGREVFAAELA